MTGLDLKKRIVDVTLMLFQVKQRPEHAEVS